jgi:hypothetical protein
MRSVGFGSSAVVVCACAFVEYCILWCFSFQSVEGVLRCGAHDQLFAAVW